MSKQKPEEQDMERRQNLLTALQILERYPKLKVKDREGKLMEMSKDLFFIDMSGRIERITDCSILQYSNNYNIFLKINKSVLQDKGIKCEE